MTIPSIKFRIISDGKTYYWGFLSAENGVYFNGLPDLPGVTADELQVMSKQFVNIQDKHGKELYIDDFFTLDSVPGTVYRVIFARYFQTTESAEFIGVSVISKADGSRDMKIAMLSPEVTKSMTVIGNVESNPELVQEELKEFMV